MSQIADFAVELAETAATIEQVPTRLRGALLRRAALMINQQVVDTLDEATAALVQQLFKSAMPPAIQQDTAVRKAMLDAAKHLYRLDAAAPSEKTAPQTRRPL